MWFNCQASVLFDVAPDSDSHRFPYYTDNNRRRWITAWCTHSSLSARTHTHKYSYSSPKLPRAVITSTEEFQYPHSDNGHLYKCSLSIHGSSETDCNEQMRTYQTVGCRNENGSSLILKYWKWHIHTKKVLFFWTKNRKTLLYACNLNLQCVIYKEECIITGENYVLAFPIHPIGICIIGVCKIKTGNNLQVVWHNLLQEFLNRKW